MKNIILLLTICLSIPLIAQNNATRNSFNTNTTVEGGATTPTFKITAEGGFAVALIAGENLNKGEIVYINQAGANNTVIKAPINNDMPIGVVYTTVLSGASVWVVCDGIAEVLPETGITAAIGYVLVVSAAEAGRADQSSTAPVASHWREVGHWIAVGSGNGVLTRAMIHFN